MRAGTGTAVLQQHPVQLLGCVFQIDLRALWLTAAGLDVGAVEVSEEECLLRDRLQCARLTAASCPWLSGVNSLRQLHILFQLGNGIAADDGWCSRAATAYRRSASRMFSVPGFVGNYGLAFPRMLLLFNRAEASHEASRASTRRHLHANDAHARFDGHRQQLLAEAVLVRIGGIQAPSGWCRSYSDGCIPSAPPGDDGRVMPRYLTMPCSSRRK